MDPRNEIPGWGVDADPSKRPGVPFYRQPPHPEPDAVVPPPRQQSAVKQFSHGRPMKEYPPVWGTAQPPSELPPISRTLRAYAYRYPDHYVRHWTVLLFADRVNVWEVRMRKAFPALAALTAIAFAVRAAAGRRLHA